MNIKRKLEITQDAIVSISRHSDVDAQVRLAALDRVIEQITAEREAIAAEVAQATAEQLG